MHRNPLYWKDADAFVPERFIVGTQAADEDEKLRDVHDMPLSMTYLPFGRGARSCIGEKFAMTQLLTVTSLFYHQYEVVLAPDCDCTPLLAGAVTTKPTHLQVHLKSYDINNSHQ